MKFFNIKNFIRFLILSVLVYAAMLFFGDYNKISSQLSGFDLLIVPEILSLVFIEYLLGFVQWNYLLKRLNMKVPFKRSILIFLSGLSMAITPGKIGEVLKSYLLKKSEGIKMRKSIIVVVVERLIDLLSLAILALIGSFAFIRSPYFQVLIIGLISVLIFAFVVLTSKKIFFKTSFVLKRLPIVKNYVGYLNQVYKSSRTLISFRTISIVTLLSVASWSLECLAFYLLLGTLNVPTSLLASIFIFSFSSVFGAATLLPGGLGSAESSFVVLMLLQGISLATATFATIIIRLCTLFWGIFIGIVSLTILNRIIEKSAKRSKK